MVSTEPCQGGGGDAGDQVSTQTLALLPATWLFGPPVARPWPATQFQRHKGKWTGGAKAGPVWATEEEARGLRLCPTWCHRC